MFLSVDQILFSLCNSKYIICFLLIYALPWFGFRKCILALQAQIKLDFKIHSLSISGWFLNFNYLNKASLELSVNALLFCYGCVTIDKYNNNNFFSLRINWKTLLLYKQWQWKSWVVQIICHFLRWYCYVFKSYLRVLW